MKNLSNTDPSLTVSPDESALEAPKPLTASRRAELWSGRLAMIGFITIVMEIAVRSGL
ncbi:MAG: hypothetical protein ACFCVD_22470 [Nodosilinea sp.]